MYDHHLIKRNQIYSLDKCSSKELYCLQISLNNSKTRSQLHFEDLFQNKDIDWRHVYLLPRRVTMDTKLRIFQYEILNNVLYLNEKLFRFKKISCPLCSFCQSENETPIHLFHGCIKANLLWYKSRKISKNKNRSSCKYATECYLRFSKLFSNFKNYSKFSKIVLTLLTICF